ncbi:MAG TPA: methyltransferase domain-containing protein [Chryseolinea sp.]|nr:methyltransferase domain-containing protein [Chryseolinea sp.]
MRSSNYKSNPVSDQGAVNRAFSKQSRHYDEDDQGNVILQNMRQQVYAHIQAYLKPGSHILELNAGTGIDALYLANSGHWVHATDLSTGMITQIEKRVNTPTAAGRISVQQLSYDRLDELKGMEFDYVFSNFGGLNCLQDLSVVTTQLSQLLRKGSYVTFVVMPRVYLWELLWIIKGQFKKALRRLNKNGVMAHLEGEYFKTYYHSLSAIRRAFPPTFEFIRSEGLCTISPPPGSHQFAPKHPAVYRQLKKGDRLLRRVFPFNRWADHIIVTFRLKS